MRETTYTFAKTDAANSQLIEVNGASTAPGARVDTWRRTVRDGDVQGNQTWIYQQEGVSGADLLRNLQTHQCLEVNGTNKTIDQWPCDQDAPNHLWTLVKRPSGGTALQITLDHTYRNYVPAGTYYLSTDSHSSTVDDGASLTLMTDVTDERTAWEAVRQD